MDHLVTQAQLRSVHVELESTPRLDDERLRSLLEPFLRVADVLDDTLWVHGTYEGGHARDGEGLLFSRLFEQFRRAR